MRPFRARDDGVLLVDGVNRPVRTLEQRGDEHGMLPCRHPELLEGSPEMPADGSWADSEVVGDDLLLMTFRKALNDAALT